MIISTGGIMSKYRITFINGLTGNKTAVNTSATCKAEAIAKVRNFFVGLILDKVIEL